MTWFWGILAGLGLFIGIMAIIGFTNDYRDMSDYLRDLDDDRKV